MVHWEGIGKGGERIGRGKGRGLIREGREKG